jgi:amidase
VTVDVIKGRKLAAPQIETAEKYICVGHGDPVRESIVAAYEAMFSVSSTTTAGRSTTRTSPH